MENKEAMKILKDFHDKSAPFSIRTALDTIIPELKESEDKNADEKIRKALIKIVTNHSSMDLFIEYDIHLDEALSWLERQGKHANFLNNIQIGDKVTRNKDGMLVNLSQLDRLTKPAEKQGKQETLCNG